MSWLEQEENLSAMNTDPWYSAYHYSHPPLVERLQALDMATKKSEWLGMALHARADMRKMHFIRFLFIVISYKMSVQEA